MRPPSPLRAVFRAMCGALLLQSATAWASVLQFAVRPTVHGDPLLLDSLRYENAAGETWSVTRLSYLLSGFALEREEGGWVELPGQDAWMDAARRRLDLPLREVPPGKYRALRFYVGLDAAANAADASARAADDVLNPNVNGLHWSWQGGYIFLALEGHYRRGGAEPMGYAYHFARDSHRTAIQIAATLDLTRDAGVLLDFDLAALLQAPRPLSFARDGGATHSREGDPIAAALAVNLPGAFQLEHVFSTTPTSAPAPAPVPPLYLPAHYTPYRFTMSGAFPLPDLPRDNPLIEERVSLGGKLFHEPALSRDGAISCASCHQEAHAFSDARPVSIGIRQQAGTRHAMPLLNLAWKSNFFWDGRAPSLRVQVLVPIQDPREMGENLAHVCEKLAVMDGYAALFERAFGDPEVTGEKIGLALENFLLTLTTHEAKFDRARRGQAALNADEQRGFELFMTEYDPRTRQFGADCFHCHGGPLFSDHQFHNNGLAPLTSDHGRAEITGLDSDRDRFSTPSLRNVARRTAYMHDGRFTTLEQVVEHYSSGVRRSATLDPNLAKHPEGGLHLGAEDQRALIAFLQTLTDGPAP